VTDLPSIPAAFDAERALRLARETFDIEAQALLGLKRRREAERATEEAMRLEKLER